MYLKFDVNVLRSTLFPMERHKYHCDIPNINLLFITERLLHFNLIFLFCLADPVDCEYIETEQADNALLTVAYVMAGVCGLCLLPVFILLGQASCRRREEIEQAASR